MCQWSMKRDGLVLISVVQKSHQQEFATHLEARPSIIRICAARAMKKFPMASSQMASVFAARQGQCKPFGTMGASKNARMYSKASQRNGGAGTCVCGMTTRDHFQRTSSSAT